MKAVVRRNIWQKGKLIIQSGTVFDYNPQLIEQFILTEEGRGYYLAADNYLVDQENPLLSTPETQPITPGSIKRITAKDGNYVFVSDRYPEDNGFTFAEILMLERIHNAIECDFETAWGMVCEIGGVISDADLAVYLAAIEGVK